MATTFKTLTNKDVASNSDLLHEAIPITGTIVSGTYEPDLNIKNYVHGMFQSVYDYPYLSSSANHIFDITAGFSSNSLLSGSTASSVQRAKKINMYNMLAQTHVGFGDNGQILEFDQDGDLTGGAKIKEAIFVNLTRLITKDEIKKGTFQATFLVGGDVHAPTTPLTVYDASATEYLVNSPVGEYTVLHTASGGTGTPVGLLYYQAKLLVLTASIFDGNTPDYFGDGASSYSTITGSLVSASISGNCDGLRNRFQNMQFNNTTELNSTIYFCRANHNEFNFSSNPTYLSSSQIVVKSIARENPCSFITSVGLYSPDNELLAVAKLSEPLKKDPANEFTLRVRLDY
jgi:hypothetical protein